MLQISSGKYIIAPELRALLKSSDEQINEDEVVYYRLDFKAGGREKPRLGVSISIIR